MLLNTETHGRGKSSNVTLEACCETSDDHLSKDAWMEKLYAAGIMSVSVPVGFSVDSLQYLTHCMEGLLLFSDRAETFSSSVRYFRTACEKFNERKEQKCLNYHPYIRR